MNATKSAQAGTFAKAARELAGLCENLAKIFDERNMLTKRVAELEKMPRLSPGGHHLGAIGKGADVAGGDLAKAATAAEDDEIRKAFAAPVGEDAALALVRLALKHGTHVDLR